MSYMEGSSSQVALNLQPRGNVTRGVDRILSVPRASVYIASATNVANNTNSALPFDTIEYDSDGMFSLTTPTRLTARTQGVYLFCAWQFYVANVTGVRALWFAKNATGRIAVDQKGASTAFEHGCVTSAPVSLAAGDYVELYTYQNSGGVLALTVATTTDQRNGFTACLISL